MAENREKLGSRLGFILLSAGCAIGCGNVWKFPTVTGQQGGGLFVLMYIFFLIVIGLPVMALEFGLGRASKRSPVMIFKALTPDKKKTHKLGAIALFGNLTIMSFYTLVTTWMFYYFIAVISNKTATLTSPQETAVFFDSVSQNPVPMILINLGIILCGCFICSFKLDKGLEKITKILMILLFVLMSVLAVYALALKGAKGGLNFYLVPNFETFSFDSVVAAAGQAFFSLSVGIGSMAIFGSYIDKGRSLLGESVTVISLDTVVAIIAGLIIFPACYTYGVEPDAGPNLIFKTLPLVFTKLKGGRIWGSMFFLFMFFAAFSTVITITENVRACLADMFSMSRKKSAFVSFIIIVVISLPCVLSFVAFGSDFCVLNIEDFILTNCLLPIGSIVYVIYATSKFGYGFDNIIDEVNSGKGIKLSKKLKYYLKFVLPVLILVVTVIGYITYDYYGNIFSYFS